MNVLIFRSVNGDFFVKNVNFNRKIIFFSNHQKHHLHDSLYELNVVATATVSQWLHKSNHIFNALRTDSFQFCDGFLSWTGSVTPEMATKGEYQLHFITFPNKNIILCE